MTFAEIEQTFSEPVRDLTTKYGFDWGEPKRDGRYMKIRAPLRSGHDFWDFYHSHRSELKSELGIAAVKFGRGDWYVVYKTLAPGEEAVESAELPRTKEGLAASYDLVWGKKRILGGGRQVTNSPLTDKFKAAWDEHEGELRDFGLSVSEYPRDSGKWQVAIFEDMDTTEIDKSKAEELSAEDLAKFDVPSPEGWEYRPFQKAGIAYAMARESTIIGDDMGIGKTIQALGVVNATPEAKSVLVICPTSIKFNWKKEAERWLVKPWKYYILGQKTRVLPKDASFAIVNYEMARIPEIWKQLMARHWDVLIVDEAHRLKSPTRLQTTAVLGSGWGKRRKDGIVDKSSRKLFLTGTPIPNRPIEIHPLLSAVGDGAFGSKETFGRRYADAKIQYDKYGNAIINPHTGKPALNYRGSSNLPELQARMRDCCMVRRMKTDVLKELPPKHRSIVVLEPGIRMKKLLKQEKAEFEAAVGRLHDVEAAFNEISAIRARVGKAKLVQVTEYIEDLLEDEEKVVVFAHHRDVNKGLFERLKKKGYNPVMVIGGGKSAETAEKVEAFQTDPKVRVFIGSIQAAGVGITLTASSTVVFAELDWVPGNLDQAEDRAYRIGQTKPVAIQWLVYDDSLDSKLAQTVERKRAVIHQALDADLAPVESETPVQQKRLLKALAAMKPPQGPMDVLRKLKQKSSRIETFTVQHEAQIYSIIEAEMEPPKAAQILTDWF